MRKQLFLSFTIACLAAGCVAPITTDQQALDDGSDTTTLAVASTNAKVEGVFTCNLPPPNAPGICTASCLQKPNCVLDNFNTGAANVTCRMTQPPITAWTGQSVLCYYDCSFFGTHWQDQAYAICL